MLDKLVATDLVAAALTRDDQPAPTDAGKPRVLLRNARGDTRQLSTGAGTPSPAFDDFLMSVASLMRLTRGVEPVYEGAPEAGYLPAGFEWAKEPTETEQDTAWAPAASAEEIARAEAEYQKKVELQQQAIEQVQAEQDQAGDDQR